jgi:AbrB family looped-hinge helix DNA binding protein
MSTTATITPQWQVTIPTEIRERLGLIPGSSLQFLVSPEGILTILPVTKDASVLKGIVPHPPQPVSLEDMNTAIETMGRDGL